MSDENKLPACPREGCSGKAFGTLERLEGVAVISADEDGTIFYVGDTDINWESMTTDTGPDGRVMLVCGTCYRAFEAPKGFHISPDQP